MLGGGLLAAALIARAINGPAVENPKASGAAPAAAPTAGSAVVASPVEDRPFDIKAEYPVRFVELRNFKWTAGGFGSVLLISANLVNDSKVDMRDFVIECIVYGGSGTIIGQVRKTYYEALRKGQSKRMRDFNMGFINSQASSVGCKVQNAEGAPR